MRHTFRALPPARQQHGGVGRGFLLQLIQELEQEARTGVVVHLELRELRARKAPAMPGKCTTQFHRLGDQSLAAAPIARARGPRLPRWSFLARARHSSQMSAAGVGDFVEP